MTASHSGWAGLDVDAVSLDPRTGVAVEKLAHFDFAKTASHQEALQTIFPSLRDISITRFSTFFRKTDFFNSHRDYHHLSHSEIGGGKRISQHLFQPGILGCHITPLAC
jgi:hypothetical protein